MRVANRVVSGCACSQKGGQWVCVAKRVISGCACSQKGGQWVCV